MLNMLCSVSEGLIVGVFLDCILTWVSFGHLVSACWWCRFVLIWVVEGANFSSGWGGPLFTENSIASLPPRHPSWLHESFSSIDSLRIHSSSLDVKQGHFEFVFCLLLFAFLFL